VNKEAAKMRKGEAEVEFKGSKACVSLDLDGSGVINLCSGWGFFDHMLNAFSRTGLLDLTARSEGGYYRAEALGKAIGQALDRALGDRSGIRRYGSAAVPMDEAWPRWPWTSAAGITWCLGEFGDRIGDFEVQHIKAFLDALPTEFHLPTMHDSLLWRERFQAESVLKLWDLRSVRRWHKREPEFPAPRA
jgi:imidazoleglycerol-phosphate dehydratase